MEDRIRKFIEFKGISPSELADVIGVQRSNVTHVLKARNKPSFQFIEKLLQAYPELNAKWLLLGAGSMIDSSVKVSRTLFDTVNEEMTKAPVQQPADPKEVLKQELKQDEQQPVKEDKLPEQKENIPPKMPEKELNETSRSSVENEAELTNQDKPIERLIVFYKDQTFKVYYPSR